METTDNLDRHDDETLAPNLVAHANSAVDS
jgi:hypothetical protein